VWLTGVGAGSLIGSILMCGASSDPETDSCEVAGADEAGVTGDAQELSIVGGASRRQAWCKS